MPAIGPDDDVRMFRDGTAVLRSTLDADRTFAFDNDLLDGEALTDLRTGFGCGVDEQLVEDRPPWAIGDGVLVRARGAGDGERAEVEGVGVDRRASGRHQPVEQPPSRERIRPEGMQDMG